jgi:hypothetical protein
MTDEQLIALYYKGRMGYYEQAFIDGWRACEAHSAERAELSLNQILGEDLERD